MTRILQNTQQADAFRSSVDSFLTAVAKKDCATFLTFLAKDSPLFAVFPNGKVVEGYESFLASQQSWFESKSGTFDYKIDRWNVSGTSGFAGVTAVLKMPNVQGGITESTMYISFVFENKNDQWILVHDQNTYIPPRAR